MEKSIVDYDYKLKILLVGDNQTGKSSIVSRYCDETFIENGIYWHGIEIKIKTLELNKKNHNDKVKVGLLILDGNGGYRFKEIIRDCYFKHQHGYILLYDVTNIESFNNLSKWISEIKNQYKTTNLYPSPEPIFFIVGNKFDLKESIVVDSKMAQQYCDSLSIQSIHNVSAKENFNVDMIFQNLSQLIMNTYPPNPIEKKSNEIH
ncbi:hypothetical protein RB653_006366 [Dictyostelium firmibasis]|uniref:Uncharacterized protein n=1 Tax=Dictyostelium firmibasis TaxID=79012 RepID=A0AAN7YTN8_9MYCE